MAQAFETKHRQVRFVRHFEREVGKLTSCSLEQFWAYFRKQSQISESAASDRPVLEILTPGELIDSIPSGFRLLALQKRLRTDIVVLVSRVRDFHLPFPDQDFPVGEDPVATRWHEVSSPRDNVNIPRMATDSNLLVIQYCQRLLDDPGLTKIERACCIALLMTLLGGSCDGFLPETSTQDIEHYIHELMSVSLYEHDEHTANLLAWVCLSVVTAVVESYENGSSSLLECEPICWDLLAKVVAYFRPSTTPTLSSTKAIMRRFILSGACDKVLEGAWSTAGHISRLT